MNRVPMYVRLPHSIEFAAAVCSLTAGIELEKRSKPTGRDATRLGAQHDSAVAVGEAPIPYRKTSPDLMSLGSREASPAVAFGWGRALQKPA